MSRNVVIDIDELYEMGFLQCTVKEAARKFGIARPTLVQKFIREPKLRRIWDAGKQDGMIELRKYQFALAQHSSGMAIFLGKNYLGQRDRFDHEHGVTERKPLPAELSVDDLRQLRELVQQAPDDEGNQPEDPRDFTNGSFHAGLDNGEAQLHEFDALED